VCRYALENWAPSPYPAVVFHEGPLPAGVNADLERLQASAASANLTVVSLEVREAMAEPWAALWKAEQARASLPWLILLYPLESGSHAPIMSASFSGAVVDSLVASPARTALAQHLLQGQGAAWILLRSGMTAQDEPAQRLLEQELQQFPATWKPMPDPNDPVPMPPQSPPQFPVVPVNRNDPAESVFAAMLLGSEPDLKGYDSPLAFPVFGRGRALYALIGPGIQANTIREACAYLSGPCSCVVKAEHPGTDLLLQADWSKIVPSAPAAAMTSSRVAEIPELESPAWPWYVPIIAVLFAFLLILVWTVRAQKKE